MRPRRFASANTVFGLPGGNEDNDLWAEKTEVDDEVLGHVKAVRTRWELTDEEREQIAAGGRVELCLVGSHNVQPLSMTVVDA